MSTHTFSRTGLTYARSIEQPTNDEIKDTPSLWNASLGDAVKYGGDLTREALSAMDLVGDKRYTIVDTKVHMLAPGQYPALPGWHTDGTPRLREGVTPGGYSWTSLHPQYKGLPVIEAQEHLDSPRFHLLVTGKGCLTRFLKAPIDIYVFDEPERGAFGKISRRVREADPDTFEIPSCVAAAWDWWELHEAKAAEAVEWRFLIRVTESDHNEPQTDLRKVIRTQNQVFVPAIDTGW
jgi:hypothetical protein